MDSNELNLIVVSVFGCVVLLSMLLAWYLFRIGYKCVPQTSKSAEDVEFKELKQEFKKKDLLVDPSKVIISDKLLGHGKFGAVYAGIVRVQEPNGLEIFRSAAVKLSSCGQAQNSLELLKEAKRQSSLKHPNIIELWGVCMEGQDSLPLVLMERVEGDDLKRHLQLIRENQKEHLTSCQLLRMAKQISDAGACLHAEKHIHRDMAARNVMLTPDLDAKLGDFGLAQNMYSSLYYTPKTRNFLPLPWMPPEVFKENKFCLKSDVWMYGVLLWETVTTGETPHDRETAETIMSKVMCTDPSVRFLPTPPDAPHVLVSIMQECWSYTATDRPAFSEISRRLQEELDQLSLGITRISDPAYKELSQLPSTLENANSENTCYSQTPTTSTSELALSPLRLQEGKPDVVPTLCSHCKCHLNLKNVNRASPSSSVVEFSGHETPRSRSGSANLTLPSAALGSRAGGAKRVYLSHMNIPVYEAYKEIPVLAPESEERIEMNEDHPDLSDLIPEEGRPIYQNIGTSQEKRKAIMLGYDVLS